MKKLEKLELWIQPSNFATGCPQPIAFKELKELTLDIYDNEFTGMIEIFERDSSENHRLVCPELEQLVVYCFVLNEKYFDFAFKNNLKKLTMFTQYDGPSIQFLSKCASHWPSLTELSIQVEMVSVDDIVKLIESCQHLQRLNILNRLNDSKIDELKVKLPETWRMDSLLKNNHFYKHTIIRQRIG